MHGRERRGTCAHKVLSSIAGDVPLAPNGPEGPSDEGVYAERDARTDRAYPVCGTSVSVPATSSGCIEVGADDAVTRPQVPATVTDNVRVSSQRRLDLSQDRLFPQLEPKPQHQQEGCRPAER